MGDSCNLPARGGHRPRHACIHHHRHRYPKTFHPCVCIFLSFSPTSRSLPILYSNWQNPQFDWNSARAESVGRLVYGKNGDRGIVGRATEYKPPLPFSILTALQTNLQSTLNTFEVHLVFFFILCWCIEKIISSRIVAKGHPTSIVILETVLATVNSNSPSNNSSKHS